MEMIFSRSWVYVGHASEIKAPGDYKTTMIGRHPVILSRLAEGGIALLVNRCRHRGATVCQRELGNSKYFRCAYHGWTYGNDGALIGFPSPGGYGADIKRADLGLVPVARVAEYRGFIFGCMSAEGPRPGGASRWHQAAAGCVLRRLADGGDRGVRRVPEGRVRRELEVSTGERGRSVSRGASASQRGEPGFAGYL